MNYYEYGNAGSRVKQQLFKSSPQPVLSPKSVGCSTPLIDYSYRIFLITSTSDLW